MTDSSSISVVLVEPQEPGNIGMAARAMKNFGVTDLKLVDPPTVPPTSEAYGFAGHARDDILPAAAETSLEAVTATTFTVGCTAITNEDATSHTRYPFVTPAELTEELLEVDCEVALVFGRERTGLTNDELAELDRICTIPAAEAYPTLNLAQAVTIVLYELRSLTVETPQHIDRSRHRATEADIERLYAHWEALLEAIGHPTEKRAKSQRLLRRLFGRIHPTTREVSTLTGIIRRSAELASTEETIDRSR